jgi:hypothetical protein
MTAHYTKKITPREATTGIIAAKDRHSHKCLRAGAIRKINSFLEPTRQP